MTHRPDIVELLRAGLSDRIIAQQVHTHRRKVRAVRVDLGIPAPQPGPAPSSPEATFWRRVQPTDDGHLLWTGLARQIGSGEQRTSVYQLAFRIRHGRPATGHVRTGCGRRNCVHPAHVQDQPMRQELNAAYAAIFGGAA
ncbi:hypothetical protein AB0891_25460 [Streptomyces sp. NPDC007259]|uniref:hypothetical protein n=1 Tax=Streptomyces sp. NPDC007259 TaxID=3154319 RepID=UPI003452AB85